MLIWTSLSTNIFFVLYWIRRILQPFSDLCLGQEEKEMLLTPAWPSTHWWINYDTNMPKYIKTAHSKCCYNKEHGPLALSWGWQRLCCLQPSLFADHSLVISCGLLSTFQRKPSGVEDPHCSSLGMNLTPRVGNHTLQRRRVSMSDRATAIHTSNPVSVWPACWYTYHEGIQQHKRHVGAAVTGLNTWCFRGFLLYPNCSTRKKWLLVWIWPESKTRQCVWITRAQRASALRRWVWSFYYLFIPQIHLIISTRC